MPEQSTIWKQYLKNWHLYTSPGRPTKSDCAIVERWLKKSGAKKVLILGATPQLRDVCARLHLNTTCIDLQKEMLEGMRAFMKEKGKEKLVQGDWLNLPFPEDSFDVILGDLVTDNIPYEDQPTFFKEIRRCLKPYGYWITRIFYQPNNWKEDIGSGIKRIAQLPDNENRHTELLFFLLYSFYDYKKKAFFLSRALKFIGECRKKEVDIHTKQLFDRITKLWGKATDKIWYAPTKSERIASIQEYFSIEEEEHTHECLFSEHLPTLLCRPR